MLILLAGNLNAERSTIEETHVQEITQVKTLYGKELGQLRNAVDAIAREKAKLEIEADKNGRESKEAKATLAQNEKRLTNAERDLANRNQRLLEVESQLLSLEDEVRKLRPDNVKLTKQLEDAKRNLEDETLKRTDLQNQLQTKEEGLKFENSMLEQQLNETRIKKQLEISEIDSRLTDAYETKLQQSLNVSKHPHSFKRVPMSIVNVIPVLGLAPNSSNWNILPYADHICSKYIVEAKQMIEGCSGMIDPKIWYNFIWAPSNNYIMLFKYISYV